MKRGGATKYTIENKYTKKTIYKKKDKKERL